MRVLVVDDEPLIRWSLREALVDHGIDVREAEDGKAAISALTDGTAAPDVVLLDYRLPDSDDLGLLTRIKHLMGSGPVILMTAFGTPEVTQHALALGAYSVVMKPFEVRDIASMIHRAHARL
jgi:DNA-binding NtrC family response regulator